MSFDTFSVAAMAAELRQVLLGGRVQRVAQINSLTFGFEIFIHPIRHYLIFSTEPQAPRLHLTQKKVRRGVGNATPLMLVLRKYMRGARLRLIEQPPYERLLYFHFDGPLGSTIFAVELLGTRSNLILLEPDNNILGVARLSRPAEPDSRQRVLIPNELYEPPRPQIKLDPPELTEHTLRQELAEASPELRLARLLPGVVRGVSPLLAREITYRATGSPDTTVSRLSELRPLLETVHQLFERLQQDRWQPTLAYDEENSPIAFAPYPLEHLPRTRSVGSISEAVEIYFAGRAAGYTIAKAPLLEAITEARQRLDRRRERLAEDAAARANPAELKEKGEAILAYAHQIQPGQAELTVTWMGDQAEQLAIALDPALSASENAQQYFNRYRKALRAADEIPAQYETIALEERYLEQLEQDLEMAEDRPEIDVVAESLAEAGYYRSRTERKKRQKRAAGRYLRLTAPEGASVWVGKNALQNAHLTFSRASADDLWLHARDVPGAHVIIPTAEGLPSEADVFWAAGVAAYYSRARLDTSVEVDVTVKKYVRAIKGAAPGLVTYRNETTLRVVPEAPELPDEE
jgi:predicted ribosome quality control (RQC) complex YloA/Tae2 family protein